MCLLKRLRALCDKHGIILIADEVQCGFGRTGTLFAMEQMGVEPDIIVTAKSIAAGMPLAAVTGRAHLMDTVHLGGIGGTYGGNPLACAAALEVMNQFQDGNLLERAMSIGGQIRTRGEQWTKQFSGIGDVRGLGGMIAIEFVKDRTTREPDPDAVAKVATYCLQHGVITMRAGLYTNCIRLLMPLVITDEQLQEGLDVLEAAMKSL